MGIHHSVMGRRMQHLQATGMEQPRSWRPRKATPREDRRITRCARRNRFATSARIPDEFNFGGHVTVGSISSACAQFDPQSGRNYHYVIGGLNGTGHVTISVEIFVIGNEFIGQTKVDLY